MQNNPVVINGNTTWMNDADYEKYRRLYETSGPTVEGSVSPGGLADYYLPRAPGEGGQLARAGAQTGMATAAGYGVAAGAGAGAGMVAGPAVGLWLMGGDYLTRAVHGDSFTPDKYKTLTEAGRSHYLDPKGEHQNPMTRARNLLYADNGGYETRDRREQELAEYLENVQPYEDMAYFNPKTLEGKYRAYGLSNWANQRIKSRWRDDLDAMQAQNLASVYGLSTPERYKSGGPFKADFSRGY